MLWLFACNNPDADALFRAHDLEGANAAWTKQTGHGFDTRHPAADVLSRRAATDATITLASATWTLGAIALLDRAQDHYLEEVDLPVDALAPLAPCVQPMLKAPWLVAVGRSNVPADPEPIDGGALPWKKGRYFGAADDEAELAALFAALDKDPPPRLTTMMVRSDDREMTMFLARRNGAWLLMNATDGKAAARYVLACKTPPG